MLSPRRAWLLPRLALRFPTAERSGSSDASVDLSLVAEMALPSGSFLFPHTVERAATHFIVQETKALRGLWVPPGVT